MRCACSCSCFHTEQSKLDERVGLSLMTPVAYKFRLRIEESVPKANIKQYRFCEALTRVLHFQMCRSTAQFVDNVWLGQEPQKLFIIQQIACQITASHSTRHVYENHICSLAESDGVVLYSFFLCG